MRIKLLISTELILISTYLILLIFSITIQPLVIIFGLICNLFLPGYNLINLIKPRSNLIQKLGYSTILSITIENISMFFTYIILYNYTTSDDGSSNGFHFNSFLIIITFQIITLILIGFNIVRYYKYDKIKESQNQIPLSEFLKVNINKIKLRNLVVFIGFIISLGFLCFSTYLSDVDRANFDVHYNDYRDTFTFFLRVPFEFYIFLATTVVLLVTSIFYNRNKYLTLICLSLFLYCLWILPFLQIKNYFSYDSYYLYRAYSAYLQSGITARDRWALNVFPDFGAFRYSTSLFTSIILTSITNTDINFSLWFLYPLIYLFIPFLFYSIYEKYSNKENNKKSRLIFLTVITILTPQILKSGHNVSTGLLGILIFLILIIEFYDFLNENNKYFKILDLCLIILLYFFLCLTHFEECIYFLIILVLYCFYLVFISLKEKTSEINNRNPSFDFKRKDNILIKKNSRYKKFKPVKNKILTITLLIWLLTLIFYLTIEFFGYFIHYLTKIIGNESFLSILLNLYQDTLLKIPIILRSTGSVNILIILIILIGIFIFFIVNSLILKYNRFFSKILSKILSVFRKNYKIFKKILNSKIFYIIFFPLILCSIIFIDVFILNTQEGNLLILIIVLTLSYSISIFHIFLFLKSFNYYNINDNKSVYFFLSLISCASIILIFTLTGNIWLAIYVLHTKFLAYLTFLNLIIIQNTYINKFYKLKKHFLVFIIIAFFILGIFYSLRALRYG
ncbi:MAG: hypothetical protein V3V33_15590 [Candidatus Lokiarchaeia archaeon]